MKLILDTSAYSAFLKGDNRLKKWFKDDHDLVVPLIVLGELRAGFAAGTKQKENETLLQTFLDAPNVTTASLTNTSTILFSKLFAKLRQAGTPMGSNDMWIAALTIELSGTLVTVDSDFSRVPGLQVAKLDI